MYIPIVCPQSAYRQSVTSSLPAFAPPNVPHTTMTSPSYPYMSTIECIHNGTKANRLHATATTLFCVQPLCMTILSSTTFTIAFPALTLKSNHNRTVTPFPKFRIASTALSVMPFAGKTLLS